MLNLHCNNNDKKRIKIMLLPRFEPRIYGFKEANGINR